MGLNNRQSFLSTTYFGPVQWYQRLYHSEQVWIERWESFQKQTLRNRCLIATANGVQALTVPVEHIAGNGLIKDVRISDHGNWRHLHWNALRSAYGKSPFYDYYEDDLYPFFDDAQSYRWNYLLDFNEAIRQTVCELLDIQPDVSYTDGYTPGSNSSLVKDFRESINPKHPAPDPEFMPRPYYQVFSQRHGFLPNLSILDLLFNMGPESVFWL